MLQDKQIDRLVSKVSRLGKVYEPYLVEQKITFPTTITQNDATRSITSGELWGKDFECATFSFVAQGLLSGKKYYVYANTGGIEHQVFVNGQRIGILDYVANAMDPQFRVHKYLQLENLHNGDQVSLEAYYSHPIVGTGPYDGKGTFALVGLYPDRPYQEVGLVTFYPELKDFCEKLDCFNSHYSVASDFVKVACEKVYLQIRQVLSLKQQRPNPQQLCQATKIIDDYFKNLSAVGNAYVGIIGHSHLDTAWLWTTDETKRKLMRTLSNAVTLLKRYPQYKFFISTVLHLKWVEEADPQLFEELTQLIKQGRIEPNGATWVECDGNLTGSEAMCRQFLRGKTYLRDKFGYEADTFWLPDTFGYSAALPQILKLCNVKYFLTTKLSWNDTNRFPYDAFLWKGIDGSTVPVHFNSIHGWVDEESVKTRLDGVINKRDSNCALMAYGFGDGGGGPSGEMVRRAIYTEDHCSVAKVEHTTVSDFMKRLSSQQLPTYFGELYLELHRGTYTTNHQLKQNNRRLEEALHDAELISVLCGDKSAKQLTDNLYDVLLLNQFHDILPGTCIPEATDMALEQQAQALKEARSYIEGNGKKAYFNTLPFGRTEILPSDEGQTYVGLNGTKTVAAFAFDAMGYGKKLAPQTDAPFKVEGETIVTPQLRLKLHNGVITSLVYNGRECVNGGFNVVKCYEDVPYIYDNWDIDADYTTKPLPVEFLGSQVVSVGQYLLVVRLSYKLTEKSTLTTDLKLRADSPVVEFENKLSFYDDHVLVRTEFQTSMFAAHYNCETQFGHVERNCYPRDKSDIAKFEVCAHKWTDLSESAYGVSLLSDSKYGVSVDGSTIGITLHKSGTHPDHRADNGESYFRYAIYPHAGSLGVDTVQAGYCFNMQPVSTDRKNLSFPFELSGDKSVVLETVKQGEKGGTVLRLYESLGATANVTLKCNGKISVCNIMEDVLQNFSNKAELTFAPFEIKTVLIK